MQWKQHWKYFQSHRLRNNWQTLQTYDNFVDCLMIAYCTNRCNQLVFCVIQHLQTLKPHKFCACAPFALSRKSAKALINCSLKASYSAALVLYKCTHIRLYKFSETSFRKMFKIYGTIVYGQNHRLRTPNEDRNLKYLDRIGKQICFSRK